VVLIEWGEKFPKLAKAWDVEIAIERTGAESRRITVTS
jgi:tRNA A37 threonylcarbamoyladenosine biosynthesis protein TsaE